MKEILDIGAGRRPCSGATRAIDANKAYVVKSKSVLGEIQRPKSLHEYRRAKAERIPYPDRFFNKVVSRWALGPRIHRRKAYREIARVLKDHGRVEIRILWKDRRYKNRVVERLREVGIEVYAEYKGIWTGNFGDSAKRRQLTEFIICGRKD